MRTASPNIVTFDWEDRGLVAVVNGAAPVPFGPAADLGLLPAGGGVVVAEAAVWAVRTGLAEADGPWTSTVELDGFLAALHVAGCETRSLSELRAKKLCRPPRGCRPDPVVLAAHVRAAGANPGGGRLWCGTRDTHVAFEEGRGRCSPRATRRTMGWPCSRKPPRSTAIPAARRVRLVAQRCARHPRRPPRRALRRQRRAGRVAGGANEAGCGVPASAHLPAAARPGIAKTDDNDRWSSTRSQPAAGSTSIPRRPSRTSTGCGAGCAPTCGATRTIAG